MGFGRIKKKRDKRSGNVFCKAEIARLCNIGSKQEHMVPSRSTWFQAGAHGSKPFWPKPKRSKYDNEAQLVDKVWSYNPISEIMRLEQLHLLGFFNLFIYFEEYLVRGAQFNEAGWMGPWWK